MKTKLHGLTKWMVAMLLCAISFTAFADAADFEGTTIEFTSNASMGSGTYTYSSMLNDKPVYVGEIETYGNLMTFTLKWKLNCISTGDDAWVIEYSSGWGDTELLWNIQPTDSVPMNGWIYQNEPASTTVSGCVVDNEVIDPLAGLVITVTGSDDLTGDFVYAGAENGKPCFVDSLATAGVTKICYYNYTWTIMIGTDSVLFTNEYSDGTTVPENNWVASEGVVSDYITLSPLEDVTADFFEGIAIDVAGTDLAGHYVYAQILNSNPVYKFGATETVSYFLLKNDSVWVIQEGYQNLLPLATAPVLTYTLKDAGSQTPSNGWTTIDGVEPVLSSDTYNWLKFVTTGEIITLSGTDFDTELVYSGDGSYTHSFVGSYNGTEVFVGQIDYVMSVQYGDSVYFTSDAYVSGGSFSGSAVPDFGWIDANGVYSALTIAGPMTGSEFEEETVVVNGVDFGFDGIVNDRISFTDGTQILKSVSGVWGLYADATATTATETSTKTDGFFVPQNGWSNDLSVTGSNVTEFVYEGDVITASNTSSAADGVYTFDALVGESSWSMYASYIKVEGADTFRISYDSNDRQWELSLGDSTFFYTEETVYLNNNSVVPQNTWISATDATSFLYLAGDFTADIYDGQEVEMGEEMLAYNGMINDRFSFGSEATTLVQYNGTTWEIVSNGAVAYTNDIISATIPSNMWVSTATGTVDESLLLSNYDYTTYYYQDVEMSGFDLAEANGTYTIVDNSSYYPEYIKVINDSTSVNIVFSWSGISIVLGDSVLCENAYSSQTNSANKKLVPQNEWTVDGVVNSSIAASGLSTTRINLVTVSGSDYDTVYALKDGIYSAKDVNYNTYVLELHSEETPYWSYYLQYSDAGDIAINYNVDGDLVPQNNWIKDGVLDTAFAVAGDSTFSTDGLNTPSSMVYLTGLGFDGLYTYMAGGYFGQVEGQECILERFTTSFSDTTYWIFYKSGGVGDGVTDVIIATNLNMNARLVPQNNWMVDGVVDSSFAVSGDSTFFVDETPASLVDSKVVEFAIYPNPAQFEVNVDVAAAGSLEVYSLSGAIVMSSFLQEGHNTVSISSLDKGMYLLITNIDGNREVSRLIKE